LFKQAQQTVAQINDKANSIAELNRKILAAQAQGEDAADLKDQRNNLLLGLSELVDVRTVDDGKGGIVVQAAGTTLVDGANTRGRAVNLASDGSLAFSSDNGSGGSTDVTKFLTGGKLAGITEARDVDLFDVSTRFDKLVFDVASAVNTQHAAGYGQDGVT